MIVLLPKYIAPVEFVLQTLTSLSTGCSSAGGQSPTFELSHTAHASPLGLLAVRNCSAPLQICTQIFRSAKLLTRTCWVRCAHAAHLPKSVLTVVVNGQRRDIISSREAIFYGVLSQSFPHGLEKKAKK